MDVETAKKSFENWIANNPRDKLAREVDSIIKKYYLFDNIGDQDQEK